MTRTILLLSICLLTGCGTVKVSPINPLGNDKYLVTATFSHTTKQDLATTMAFEAAKTHCGGKPMITEGLQRTLWYLDLSFKCNKDK